MILYYSATGNTRHVAHRLAEAFDDQAVSILDAQSDGRRSFELAAGETLGIVTPTYFMGLPTLMSDFLDTLELHTADDTPYAYLVITFGNFSGTVRSSTAAALRAKGIPLAAAFGVRMVDTWTPVFDVSNQERNERITRTADAAVDDIVAFAPALPSWAASCMRAGRASAPPGRSLWNRRASAAVSARRRVP